MYDFIVIRAIERKESLFIESYFLANESVIYASIIIHMTLHSYRL